MNEISYEERKKVYENAIEKYGNWQQVIVAIEEMSELQKELCKCFREEKGNTEHIAEEIADTTIMLEQLRMIFDCNDLTREIMDKKIRRLAKRVED